MRDERFLLSPLPCCSWPGPHPATGARGVILDPNTVVSQPGTSPPPACPLLSPHASSCHGRAPLTLIPPDSAFLLSFSAGEWHMPALCPFSFPAPGTPVPLGTAPVPLLLPRFDG